MARGREGGGHVIAASWKRLQRERERERMWGDWRKANAVAVEMGDPTINTTRFKANDLMQLQSHLVKSVLVL